MLFNRGGRPGGQGDCAEDIKNWWIACPTFYKFLFVATTFNYLFQAIFSQIFYYLLVQVPVRTVSNFFFWTLSTTFLCPRDFFDWLIGLYLVYYDGKTIEKRIGTVHYAIEFVFKNTLIQIAYVFLMYLGSFILSPYLLSLPSYGLFPTFMLFLTLRGLANPEEERPFMCFPINVRNKMYPWILYGLICLISQSLVPDLLAAIGIAYLEVYFFNGQILTMSKSTLQRYEKGCIFGKLSNRPDFITTDGAGNDDGMSLPMQNQSQQQQQQQPTHSAFAGRGVSIGQGSSGPAQPVYSQQPPQQVVINPSAQQQQQISDNEKELRRQAALAAEARLAQQSNSNDNNQNQNEPENIDDLPDKNQNKQKKGYDQLNEESPQEDLL